MKFPKDPKSRKASSKLHREGVIALTDEKCSLPLALWNLRPLPISLASGHGTGLHHDLQACIKGFSRV